MKRVCGFVLLFGSFAGAQCTALVPGPGTACVAPVWAYESVPTTQTAVILVDISLPPPLPEANKYILSFANGTFQVSENGQPYHTLVGPKGDKGDTGATGPRGPQGVPGVIVGNTITATEVCNIVSGVRTCKLKVLAIQ